MGDEMWKLTAEGRTASDLDHTTRTYTYVRGVPGILSTHHHSTLYSTHATVHAVLPSTRNMNRI